MIRPPLFGKDSSPQYTAPRLSAMATAALTVIFFLVVIFVPAPKPKQKYETVRIVLDTTPIEQILKDPGESSGSNEESLPANTEEFSIPETSTPAEPVVEEAPAVEAPKPVVKESVPQTKKAEPVPEPKASVKTEPKVEEPKFTKRTDTKLYKSVEDTWNEIADSRTYFVQDQPDWDSMFDDTPSSTPAPAQTVQKVTNALSGSAASSTKTTDRQSTTESSTLPSTQTSVDKNTSSALAGISKATYTEKTYSSGSSTLKMKTADTAGGTSVSMNDGSSRILLKPREPKISIDPEDAESVQGSPTVTISFKVLPNGLVQENSISITPKSLIPEGLFEDIKFQLSNWKFQAGETEATASFAFTIKKN